MKKIEEEKVENINDAELEKVVGGLTLASSALLRDIRIGAIKTVLRPTLVAVPVSN